MPILPSSEQLAENIRKHVERLAKEIANRAAPELGQLDPLTLQTHEVIERHAKGVLLDWFLGDFVP